MVGLSDIMRETGLKALFGLLRNVSISWDNDSFSFIDLNISGVANINTGSKEARDVA